DHRPPSMAAAWGRWWPKTPSRLPGRPSPTPAGALPRPAPPPPRQSPPWPRRSPCSLNPWAALCRALSGSQRLPLSASTKFRLPEGLAYHYLRLVNPRQHAFEVLEDLRLGRVIAGNLVDHQRNLRRRALVRLAARHLKHCTLVRHHFAP